MRVGHGWRLDAGLHTLCCKSKEKEFNTEDTEEAQRPLRRVEKNLIDFFLMAEISEGADVGDYEGNAKLIVGAHLAESKAAVLESDAAALAVVADLHELFLQGAIREVVADASGDVEPAASFAAVA